MDQTADQTRERIERALGGAPPPPPLDPVLAAGRRALLRRRLAAGAAAAAVAAVTIGTAAIATPDPDRTALPAAGGPTRASAPARQAPSVTADPGLGVTGAVVTGEGREPGTRLLWDAVTLEPGGRLVLADGVELLTRVDDPFGVGPARDSAGVAALVDGWEVWFALVTEPDGSGGGTSLVAAHAHRPFDAWLVDQSGIAAGSGADGRPDQTVGEDVWPGVADLDLVTFDGASDTLVARDGVRILEQRGGVDVGGSWAGPGDRTAAADVTDADGERWFVLARSLDGKPGQFVAVPHDQGGADLDAFLELARERYAEGGGGLL